MFAKSVKIFFVFLLLPAACGKQVEDLSYTNPDWRVAMRAPISFPIDKKITLSVGLSSGTSRPDNMSIQWLEERTNIHLEFITLPRGPGDIEFGTMIREGRLPDIIPEGRLSLNDTYIRKLFVDVQEFPSLTPNFNRLLKENTLFRKGVLSKLYMDDALYSLASYKPAALPFEGVLAYRRDLFEKYSLKHSTWDEILSSLKSLKEIHPESYPFGGTFDNILHMCPSWFGSGLDKRNIVYFNPDVEEWVFGPFEKEFEDYIRFFSELYRRKLIMPDVITGRDALVQRYFANDIVFMAPYRGPTGPGFAFMGEDYGRIGYDGNWNGKGKWVSSMEIPQNPGGGGRWINSVLWSNVSDGWLVYNQSSYASEALALLDFLYDEETALVMALGPEGKIWEYRDDIVNVKEEFLEKYRSGGWESFSDYIKNKGIITGIPIRGLYYDTSIILGFPEFPAYNYYIHQDVSLNQPDRDIIMQPGLRISGEEDFSDDRINLAVGLKTVIDSKIANFITGNRDLSEYNDFKEELLKLGADKLLDLYRKNSGIVDSGVLLNRRR
jgi:ABC-type glycerol-3-phosphate transport system substrate-binding protein